VLLGEPEDIRWDPHFVYPIHHAEHARLDAKQRQSVQHFAEMAQRLVRKRDQYRARVLGIPRTGLGLRAHPTPELQDELFEMTHAFFEHLYATLGALASVHGRVKIFNVDPPISSVERFLAWWATQGAFFKQEESLEILVRARNFRNLIAHPQQNVVFDWGTHAIAEDNVKIVLHGEVSSAGNVPTGAARDGSHPRLWIFEAPSLDEVVFGLMILTSITFHLMPGTFPLEDGESTCTWEAEGLGSAYWIALQERIAQSARSDPSVAHLVDPADEV
jgi:hypothetical protein